MKFCPSLASAPVALAAAVLCFSPAWGVTAAPLRLRQKHRAAHSAPLTAAALAKQLAATFHKPPFTRDSVAVRVQDHVIRISGEIRLAENRGIATRDARHAAHAAHWNHYRVVNTLQVR